MIRVTFAEGSFDDFDGTQEELDQLVKEITNYFHSLTPEELAKELKVNDKVDEWQNFGVNIDATPKTLH